MATETDAVSIRHVRVLRRRQRHADDRHDGQHGCTVRRRRTRPCLATTSRLMREPVV